MKAIVDKTVKTVNARKRAPSRPPDKSSATPHLIQARMQEGAGIHADVFKRVNAAHPLGVRLWDEDTGDTLEVRLCKSLDDAIYSARGATFSSAPNASSPKSPSRPNVANHPPAAETLSAIPA
jgi:hypothetical protein